MKTDTDTFWDSMKGYCSTYEDWAEKCEVFMVTLEHQRNEARAEAQRLREAILKILPGMKAQRPPALGAWNWPYAVKELEEALEGPTVTSNHTSPTIEQAKIDMQASYDHMMSSKPSPRIITAHGKEWWVHDGTNECPCDPGMLIHFLFRYEMDRLSYEKVTLVASTLYWGDSGDETMDVIAWRPADAPDKLPREGGEG